MTNEKITANQIKAFFKSTYGLTVRVRSSKHFVETWVPYSDIATAPRFPEDFRNRCLRAIYGEKDWTLTSVSAGNIREFSLAMTHREWAAMLAPVDAPAINA